MNAMDRPEVRKLVIVGGGTAGWITAAAFARLLGQRLQIELVESEAIGTVGVGEATIPQIIRLNAILGLDENAFLSATSGTFKLGIEFVDWGRKGSRYLHTFGDTGMTLANVAFHHHWRRSAGTAPDPKGLWDFSLHQLAADQARFGKLDRVGNTAMTGLAYAYHFDASRYALFLRDYAEGRGVTRTESIVESVARDGESGDIRSITLKGGKEVAGDFFIDCTGFRALLLGETLGVGYRDWSKWLPCDRALAVPSERLPVLVPYTRATARDAGWQWRIPLQHRTGNGHVYSSGFATDDAAADLLMAGLDTRALGDPRPIRFTTGRREAFWAHNCAAIGLSSGFLEPLESTSIHLIQSHVSRLIQLFPRAGDPSAMRAEYNRRCEEEFAQIRDFLILHYHRTDREDTEFWRFCKHMDVPDSLTHKIALFASSGRVGRDVDDLFRDASWVQVMLGQGIVPADYDPMADQLSEAQLAEFLANLRMLIARAVGTLPTHEEYLARHCPADASLLAA
ncbi:tryptophan halogenase family protein [Porphyrobacter sp. CACIAM 03H1]|uniref:tryptophan halogenase family protein n=1 Tax=Porphyrobacter sp. CACIAM 03H1 TaxID=2003315 RepID=UPI000B5AA90C|nr:tryptophan halogenase family protein [Porphyrobacter sp. CACIAM 03H1]ASJ92130.1 tryptophan halogenase [Porphyrobacter sp. CACIAM 03H1]